MKILIVDDQPAVCRALAARLREHEVVSETDPIQALARLHADLESHPFDVVLSDYSMRGMDGIQLLAAAKALYSPPIVILMTGYEEVESAAQTADAMLIKPFTSVDLLAAIHDAKEARSRRSTTRIPRMVAVAHA